jgi:hypothetical protein
VPEVERAWFLLCLGLGRLLRAGRYSDVQTVPHEGALEVRKRRRFYAPILVGIGGPLATMLNTGVKVLSQREWEHRERTLYRSLYGTEVRIANRRTLILPRLPGETLAALLEKTQLSETVRHRAIELAAEALAGFHRRGFTHGDAMAENVLVDLDGGVANWFDFETVHEPARSAAWRRADDVRALLATCLLRTRREACGRTLDCILDAYGDDGLTPLLAASFSSALRRPLTFHLGQAGLTFRCFRDIAGRLRNRSRPARVGA